MPGFHAFSRFFLLSLPLLIFFAVFFLSMFFFIFFILFDLLSLLLVTACQPCPYASYAFIHGAAMLFLFNDATRHALMPDAYAYYMPL